MRDDCRVEDDDLAGVLPPQNGFEIEDPSISERQAIFLEAISQSGCRDGEAAAIAGVHRVTAWRWQLEPRFADQVREARKVGVQKLIAEAERRAMRGSDMLLKFLLCNYDPERFRDRQAVDVKGNVSLEVYTGIPSPVDDLL